MEVGTTSILAGGTLAAFWGQVKTFFSYIRNLVIVTSEISFDKWATMDILTKYIYDNSKIYRLGEKKYRFCQFRNKEQGFQDVIVEKNMSGKIVALYKYLPIIITINTQNCIVSFTYFKFLFNIEKLLKIIFKNNKQEIEKDVSSPAWYIRHEWSSNYTQYIQSRAKTEATISSSPSQNKETESDLWQYGYKSIYYNYGKLIECENKDSLGFIKKYVDENEHYYISKEAEKLKNEIRFWLDSKKWYEKTGIQWKRGALLYGEPGTGKSSMVYNISKELDIPVSIFHLEGFNNKDLLEEWKKSQAPSIILIEDIDNIFDKRKFLPKTNTDIGLTFDNLLNTIDGVEQLNGIFLIITTNNYDKIDSALLRPGRLDSVFCCQKLDIEGAKYITNNILFELSEQEKCDFIKEKIELPATAAKIQEICIKEAIRRKWENIK